MIANSLLTGCDLDESWWSRRRLSYALTWRPLFSISVFLLWNIAVLWLKVGKQSRNCDYSQQAEHSPRSGPRCDDIVCGSAISHYRLGEQELSLTCSAKPVLHTMPKVPFRFINKESNKNWRAEPLLGSSPRTSLLRAGVLSAHQVQMRAKMCFAELLNPFLEELHLPVSEEKGGQQGRWARSLVFIFCLSPHSMLTLHDFV